MHRLGVEQSVPALLVVDSRDAVAEGECQFVNGMQSFSKYTVMIYSKLPCSRSAIGASGFTMTLHASGTSTSRIALRLRRLAMDREPRVATSLDYEM